MPDRIQLPRHAGWRMPPNTVSVARPHRWGNPFRIVRGADGRIEVRDVDGVVRSHALTMPEARRTAVALYRESITPEIAAQAHAQLGGRNLACFCPPSDACHVDVLLDVANARSSAADEPLDHVENASERDGSDQHQRQQRVHAADRTTTPPTSGVTE